MVTLEAREYLQVDLGAMHAVTAVQTQGRFGNGMGQEYAEAYMLEYWRPGLDRWLRWRDRRAKELLQGNSNTYTVVEQRLEPPVLASRVRFVPYSEHLRTVCMRVELLGCRWTEGLLSYAMPQGAQRGPGLDLRDRLYDGRDEGGRLSGGLGQLSDGRRGADLFRLDQQAHAKGSEWVGWRNDSAALLGRPVEITFDFDHVRNFSAMFLHTSNLYSKDVQVFSHAKVYFSVSGRQYSPEPVFFSYMADLALEHARNVTIKLHGRVGRFVKLQLHFAARWILLSEVAFDSVVVAGNFTDGDAAPAVAPAAAPAAPAAPFNWQQFVPQFVLNLPSTTEAPVAPADAAVPVAAAAAPAESAAPRTTRSATVAAAAATPTTTAKPWVGNPWAAGSYGGPFGRPWTGAAPAGNPWAGGPVAGNPWAGGPPAGRPWGAGPVGGKPWGAGGPAAAKPWGAGPPPFVAASKPFGPPASLVTGPPPYVPRPGYGPPAVNPFVPAYGPAYGAPYGGAYGGAYGPAYGPWAAPWATYSPWAARPSAQPQPAAAPAA